MTDYPSPTQVPGGESYKVCHVCQHLHTCRNLKAAHVPLYAWICKACESEWCDD